ncbi:hypothetical protein E2C01_073918 [Portunus trituberculatus]|uniref:Uncharacterized protein n=1 Tax=Portunus trituberculatus TaxID=210409 RepID=A0A5B7I6M1_PORTR|nr:hypothetical protein [Portunus trituberculatus]
MRRTTVSDSLHHTSLLFGKSLTSKKQADCHTSLSISVHPQYSQPPPHYVRSTKPSLPFSLIH